MRRGIAAVGLMAASAAVGRAAPDSLELQVNRAIERGLAVVRQQIGPDGAGRTSVHGDYPEGDTALVLYTLVKSGVPADDPQVKTCLAWLRGRPMTRTYGAAAYILALDAFRDRTFDEDIRRAAKWLEDGLLAETASQLWSYPGHHVDLSNTQYGALGLWTAERHGFEPREDTWTSLLGGVVAMEKPGDGFAYRADARTTGAMTVAGVTVLELALERSPGGELPARFAETRRKAKAALAKGWAYLERRFSVEGNPLEQHSHLDAWFHYYLYGVERLCAITGRTSIGGRDWYSEGARALVASQRDDGSWGEPWDTCFALLFLRRATFTTMRRDLTPLAGDAVAARAPAPARPAPGVPFVRRWLLLGPLDDPDDELLEQSFFNESRAAPVDLAYSGAHRWDAFRSFTDQVDLGGGERPNDRSTTCAFVWVHAAKATQAVLWFGHDNGARVWFDGSLVHDKHFEQWFGPDSFSVRVRLEQGPHRLLMKVQNGGGPHSLWLRIAHEDGAAAPEIRTSLTPESPEFEAAALANPSGVPLDDLLCLLPREKRAKLTFEDRHDADAVAVDGGYGPYPLWSAAPDARASHLPNPGASGVFAIHAQSPEKPMTAYLKMRIPEGSPRLRLRVSATTASSPGSADAVLRVGVYDGETRWLLSETIGPDRAAFPGNWRWVDTDLPGCAGREVLLLLEASNGGRTSWNWEGIWIDELEVR